MNGWENGLGDTGFIIY